MLFKYSEHRKKYIADWKKNEIMQNVLKISEKKPNEKREIYKKYKMMMNALAFHESAIEVVFNHAFIHS
jgi:hypothetical protein